MIDSGDRDRIDEARLELERILADREMKECLLMVFANKQDLPGGESYILPLTLSLAGDGMRRRSYFRKKKKNSKRDAMQGRETANERTMLTRM